MRYRLVAPKRLSGDVLLPASKSISNRVLLIHALAKGGGEIENLSTCDDAQVMKRALKEMPEVIDVEGAGTAMRFLTAYLSMQTERPYSLTHAGTHILTGSERMKQRPIGVLVDALRRLGARIEYLEREGFPPLRITEGDLSGGKMEMRADISSQYISAILMIAPLLPGGLELHLTGDIMSRPYIDLTLCVMRDFGARADWTDMHTIKVEPGAYKNRSFAIESDWTAASYWYELVALSRSDDTQICLQGLIDGSRQGDAVVRYLFSMMGVKTKIGTATQGVPTTVTLKKGNHHLPRMDYDFTNQPDIAQTVIVTCCLSNTPFHFKGLETLRIKESNRIKALKNELRKLGYVVETNETGELTWDGQRTQPMDDPIIETYNDHRMALAFAPACMTMPSISIDHPEVVSKSYPDFWAHLQQAGIEIFEEPS